MTPENVKFSKQVKPASRRKIIALLTQVNEIRSRHLEKGFKPMAATIRQFQKKFRSLVQPAEKKKAIALVKARATMMATALLKKKNPLEDDSLIRKSARDKFRATFRKSFLKYNDIVRLKRQYRADLNNLLSDYQAYALRVIPGLRIHLPDLLALPENDYVLFKPPYEFNESSANFDLEADEYNIADLQSGFVASGFKVSIDSMDIAIIFDIDPWVIFETYAGVGVSYTLPKAGILRITVVAQNTQSLLHGSLYDDFGFSDGDIQMTAGLYVNVLHPNNVHIHEQVMTSLMMSSDGDDISRTQSNLQTDSPYEVILHSTGAFAAGETVQIVVGSKVTVLNRVDDMHTYNQVDVSWQIKAIYVEVV